MNSDLKLKSDRFLSNDSDKVFSDEAIFLKIKKCWNDFYEQLFKSENWPRTNSSNSNFLLNKFYNSMKIIFFMSLILTFTNWKLLAKIY